MRQIFTKLYQYKKTLITLPFCALLVFCVAYVVFIFFEIEKNINAVSNHKMNVSTQVFDRKGRLIANVFQEHHRLYARLDEIPVRIVEILLAVEDTVFFEHNGINLDAISRAMLKNIQHLKYAEGGSTLTQQVVKNIALSSERSLKRKIKEIIFALIIEKQLSKEEILEIYLNHIFLGHGYYGVRTAALGYFRKDLEDLSLKEMAMLMSLPKAPSTYDPTKNYKLCISRANSIIERMQNIGWISAEEYKRALNEQPKVYNDDSASRNLAPYAVDEMIRTLQKDYPDLKTGGYEIRLNIDLDYQYIAQNAIRYGYNNINARLLEIYPNMFEVSKDYEEIDGGAKRFEWVRSLSMPKKTKEDEDEGKLPFLEILNAQVKPKYMGKYGELNGAIVVTESNSGKILALVGGIDYKSSQFNRATQIKRQFGSSIKPFLYLSAFNNGFSPAWLIPDAPKKFGENTSPDKLNKTEDDKFVEEAKESSETQEEQDIWTPKNMGSYGGYITLFDALKNSANLATINLVEQVGFSKIYNDLKTLGFNAPRDLSIALGSLNLSPIEVARSYSVFSNQGTILTPQLIESIAKYDEKERKMVVIKRFEKEEQYFTEPKQAYLVSDIMQAVVQSGTGRRARVGGVQIAGKTGTSNKNNDGWFCGFTPSLQIIIWYGRDNNTPIGPNETGGVVSAPVASFFFTNVLRKDPNIRRKFSIPEDVQQKNIDGKTYLYTDISKLPPESEFNLDVHEDLMF